MNPLTLVTHHPNSQPLPKVPEWILTVVSLKTPWPRAVWRPRVYLNTDVTVTVCNMNRGKVKNLQQESPSTVWGVGELRWHFCSRAALLEWMLPAMCFHFPGLEDANRIAPTAVMTRTLCGHTAGGASVVKLMQYPSTLHRQLRTLQLISGKVRADDLPPPPRMSKIRRAWLQVTPVFSSESIKAKRACSAF